MSTKSARPKASAASASLAKKSTSPKLKRKSVPKLTYEVFDWANCVPSPVIGVDEVGRGCLAGPVFAAAVILPADFSVAGVTDSKLLSESRREELAARIYDCAQVGVGFASVGEVDRLNILNATFTAMRRAIENLVGSEPGGHVLVDGNMKIRLLDECYFQTPLVKGDLRATPIAAASIVAKVARDQFMRRLALDHPLYGFEKHKGYASPVHTEAIQVHGPCVHHRATFAGVREYWTELLDEERSRDPF